MIEITTCTIMLSLNTVLRQKFGKQGQFLQVKYWRLGFACYYRETTNKPLFLGRLLRKASTLRAVLSGKLTWKSTSWHRQNVEGERQSWKMNCCAETEPCLSQVTELCLFFSNDLLTRWETPMA